VDAGDRGLPFAGANIASAFANADSRTIGGVNNMGKRITDYPHTISFRVTDEAWLAI